MHLAISEKSKKLSFGIKFGIITSNSSNNKPDMIDPKSFTSSKYAPTRKFMAGESRLWGTMQILTRRSGNSESLPLKQT